MGSADVNNRLINRAVIGPRRMIEDAEHEVNRGKRAEQHKQPNSAPSHLSRAVLCCHHSTGH